VMDRRSEFRFAVPDGPLVGVETGVFRQEARMQIEATGAWDLEDVALDDDRGVGVDEPIGLQDPDLLSAIIGLQNPRIMHRDIVLRSEFAQSAGLVHVGEYSGNCPSLVVEDGLQDLCGRESLTYDNEPH